jgi:hypothetical protein
MLRLRHKASRAAGLLALAFGLAACTQDIALPDVSSPDARPGGTRDGGRDLVIVSPGRDAAVDGREAGPDRAPPDAEERCEQRRVTFQHPRVILALDRSTSMQEKPAGSTVSRLHGVQHVLEALMKRYYRAVYFGYVEFPVADCPAGTCCAGRVVTPARDTLGPIQRRWSCELEPASCQSTTKDSPVAEALMGCRREFENGGSDFDQRHVFLITDGDPSCSASAMDDECVRAGQEAGRLVSQEATTTVFALSDTLQTSACLADLANIGGSGAPVFAPNNDVLKEKLEERVNPVAREACSFRLSTSLDPSEKLYIWLNGTEVKRDPSRTEGWEFDEVAPTKVTFYGSWCTKLSTSAVTGSYVESCRPG